jgi:hypothetical protein
VAVSVTRGPQLRSQGFLLFILILVSLLSDMGHVAASERSVWGGGIQSHGVHDSIGALPYGGAEPGAAGHVAAPEPRGSVGALPC